jgi:hypothetical protein
VERIETLILARQMGMEGKLTAYVHKHPDLGYNFRFARAIEEVDPRGKSKTEYVFKPDGTYETRGAGIPLDFDEYVKVFWPAEVPEDCTGAKTEDDNEEGEDCLEQNRDDSHQCDSCRAYSRLSEEYEALNKDSQALLEAEKSEERKRGG